MLELIAQNHAERVYYDVAVQHMQTWCHTWLRNADMLQFEDRLQPLPGAFVQKNHIEPVYSLWENRVLLQTPFR